MTMHPKVVPYFTEIPATVELSDAIQPETVMAELHRLGIPVPEVEVTPGLRVSLAHLTLPRSTRLKALRAVAEDIALGLGVHSVRVRVGGRPGQVTLEIAHEAPADAVVSLRDALVGSEGLALPWAMGLTAEGTPLCVDLAEAPHVLVGGQTGSGKSSHLQSLVLSLALSTTPEECEMVFIDPKRVDLFPFRTLPHVTQPVATTLAEAVTRLTALEQEVSFRFTELQHAAQPDIAAYNSWASATEGESTLPRIVVVIDELSALLTGKEGQAFGDRLTQLAQISRAAGVHLVCATQRPSAATLPTQLRSQLTSRVACRMATASDSRMILDVAGAEQLLGAGDTLVSWGGAAVARLQGTYVSAEWRQWLTTALAHVWYVPPAAPVEPSAPSTRPAILDMEDASTPTLWSRLTQWIGRGTLEVI